MSTTIRREIPTATRVISERQGVVEYVASDETLDSYKEVIRANGWRFARLLKNGPFVDSHDYDSIEKLLGKILHAKVEGKRLIETVQWAKDVAENRLAQIGWKMTVGGFLKAVSVGFQVLKSVSRWDSDLSGYRAQLLELGYTMENGPRTIYIEQDQLELSAVILGANPNALAKAYKADALSDSDIEWLSKPSGQSSRERFLQKFERLTKAI